MLRTTGSVNPPGKIASEPDAMHAAEQLIKSL
jgi:hypothetical protein